MNDQHPSNPRRHALARRHLRRAGAFCGLLAVSLSAQPAGHFTAPKLTPGIPLLGQFDFGHSVTADGLLMVFNSNGTLYRVSRRSRSESFGDVTALGPNVNAASFEQTAAALTGDGLVLVFQRDPIGPTPIESSAMDLFETRRGSVSEPFGEARPMLSAIDDYSAFTPWVSQDGLLLLFSSTRPGSRGSADIWAATRSSLDEPFRDPVNFDDFFAGSQVNTPYEENGPCLSSDGLVVFVADLYESRAGSRGGPDIWMATRPNQEAPFGPLVNLNGVGLGSVLNGNSWDGFVFVSRDWPAPGSKLSFSSNRRLGGFEFDYWEAEWVPFRIAGIHPTPVGMELNVTAKAGRSVQVQVCDDLESGGWIDLGTPIVATSDSVSLTVPLFPSAQRGFLRVAAP